MAGVTTSFRKPFAVMRAGSGDYVSGIWTPNPETTVTISATIQPASLTDYDQLQAELGGERFKRVIRIYTDAELNVADPRADASGRGSIADVVLYPYSPNAGPGRYRIVSVAAWQSGVLSHYKYLATADLEA